MLAEEKGREVHRALGQALSDLSLFVRELRNMTGSEDAEPRVWVSFEDIGRVWSVLYEAEADVAAINDELGGLREQLRELTLLRNEQEIEALHSLRDRNA